jgi:hypothetical protein
MKKWIFAISFVAVGALAIVVKNSLDVGNASAELQSFDLQASQQKTTEENVSNVAPNVGEAGALEADTFVADLIVKLRNTHIDDIHLLHIQASLIQVKEFVLKRYPDNGNEIFIAIIEAAFPEYASSILALLDKLGIFNEWLIDNQADLLAMEHQIQQGMVWEKRRELFGDNAEKIWAHELSGMAQQKNAMQEVIHTLDQAHEISMDEKLYQLQTAISEQLEGSIQNEAVSGAVISKVFFTLNSVQQELASMDSEGRQEKINDIRSQLGLNQEQIERLQANDQDKEKRWEKGLAYMAEREQLLASVDEYSRSEALDELRQRYFGRDALTIQREEESDFWRYKRKRIYGVN